MPYFETAWHAYLMVGLQIWTEIRRELRERDFFLGASGSRQRRVRVDTQKPTGRIVAPAACWPGGMRPDKLAGNNKVRIMSVRFL